jgi:hypothetical protein
MVARLGAPWDAKPGAVVRSTVKPDDLVILQSINDQLGLACVTMKADNFWLTLVPSERGWNEAGCAMKILAVALYERLFGATLLERAKVFAPALALAELAVQAAAAEPATVEATAPEAGSGTHPVGGNSDAPLTAA